MFLLTSKQTYLSFHKCYTTSNSLYLLFVVKSLGTWQFLWIGLQLVVRSWEQSITCLRAKWPDFLQLWHSALDLSSLFDFLKGRAFFWEVPSFSELVWENFKTSFLLAPPPFFALCYHGTVMAVLWDFSMMSSLNRSDSSTTWALACS